MAANLSSSQATKLEQFVYKKEGVPYYDVDVYGTYAIHKEDWGLVDRLADTFRNSRPRVNITSLRKVMRKIKSLDREMRTIKDFPQERIESHFDKLITHCRYQNSRENPILPTEFVKFIEEHRAAATASKEDYLGFVEMFTSILVAVMVQEKRDRR